MEVLLRDLTGAGIVIITIAGITFVVRLILWYGSVNDDRGKFEDFMKEVRQDIKDILARLPREPAISSGSPLQLTGLGNKISKEIGAEEWANNEATTLLGKAKEKDPFEIQAMAFDHTHDLEPPEEMLAKMRASAFENGLDLDIVRRVMGIVLRDRILKMCGPLPSSLDRQED